MSKHTPGPWEVYENDLIAASQSFPFNVVVGYGVSVNEPNVIANRMSEANARLIAESPTMYELLKELVRLNELRGGWKSQTPTLINSAKLVISHVEGGL